MDELWKQILGAIGAMVGTYITTKWALGTKRVAEWRRKRKAFHDARESMFQSWPSALREMQDIGAKFSEASQAQARITREFAALNTRLDQQDENLAHIRAMQWGQMKLEPQARFVCTTDGRNILVNTAYAKLLQVGEHELLGFGYKNRIAPEDEADYIARWERAAKEHRPFEDTITFIRGDGTRFAGHVRLEPYPDDPRIGPAPHWFGVVTKVKDV